MNNGEIGILRADELTLDLTRMQEAPDQEVKLSPAPYPHWTLKTNDFPRDTNKDAERLNGKEHCFVLGKGHGEHVTYEGASKIKEMCYLCYSGRALKHGPFAFIESDKNRKPGAMPIIMLILDDCHAHHMRTAAEEVKARGADVIVITDKVELADGLTSNPIVIPSNGPMTALGAVMPI